MSPGVGGAQKSGEEGSAHVEFGDRASAAPQDGSEAKLEDLARSTAEDVARTGESVLLDPMTARERFLVHNTIRDVVGASSHSITEGREKRVKVVPEETE